MSLSCFLNLFSDDFVDITQENECSRLLQRGNSSFTVYLRAFLTHVQFSSVLEVVHEEEVVVDMDMLLEPEAEVIAVLYSPHTDLMYHDLL